MSLGSASTNRRLGECKCFNDGQNISNLLATEIILVSDTNHNTTTAAAAAAPPRPPHDNHKNNNENKNARDHNHDHLNRCMCGSRAAACIKSRQSPALRIGLYICMDKGSVFEFLAVSLAHPAPPRPADPGPANDRSEALQTQA